MKRSVLLALVAGTIVARLAEAAPLNGSVAFTTKRGQKPVTTETLVWLEPASKAVRPPAARTFTLTTRNKVFIPHILAVPLGSTVHFPNEDPISHNLFSLSAGLSFDLGLYRNGPGKSQTFTRPGVVNLYCNIHPAMSAVIHVMETPFYRFADEQGRFAFDVPAGKYRLVAWNELGGTAASDVEVRADGRTVGATALTIDARSFRPSQHRNKHGQGYRNPRDY